MKSKIQETYPKSEIRTMNSPMIYVADFSERTKGLKKGEGRREVEIHSEIPLTPDGAGSMDCLALTNEERLNIDFNIFNDHQFKKEDKDDSHCECCFFLADTDESSWISFIEIKDCKLKNIPTFKEKVKAQIISTVSHFKKEGIIVHDKRIYGIISFPRRTKTAFNDYIFRTHHDILDMKRNYGILFLPSNTIKVSLEKLDAL